MLGMNTMKQLLKALAKILLGEYALYYIYTRSAKDSPLAPAKVPHAFTVQTVDAAMILKSEDPLILQQAGYLGSGTFAYACLEGPRIVGLCFYWFGERYRERNFWPLLEREAKLVQIISLAEMRGRGIASRLIEISCQDLLAQKFERIYARIWHSNLPSIKAFERAGWKRIALVIEINPLRRAESFKIRINSKLLIR
ncbi:GNAT family N-acetyltransferase [Undibacterium parvum]|uniref:GNAT family N-acetyltransferase n=2 Tax=Undibacterium parvum TaxID=401471 RepID=A0A3Q9BQL8_9BURK|nr:GNAT family N-acetyltransferase [Undibacterium parvum]